MILRSSRNNYLSFFFASVWIATLPWVMTMTWLCILKGLGKENPGLTLIELTSQRPDWVQSLKRKSTTHGLTGSTKQGIWPARLLCWISILKPRLLSSIPAFPAVGWKSPSSHKTLKFSSIPSSLCSLFFLLSPFPLAVSQFIEFRVVKSHLTELTYWDDWTRAGMFWTLFTPLPVSPSPYSFFHSMLHSPLSHQST